MEIHLGHQMVSDRTKEPEKSGVQNTEHVSVYVRGVCLCVCPCVYVLCVKAGCMRVAICVHMSVEGCGVICVCTCWGACVCTSRGDGCMSAFVCMHVHVCTCVRVYVCVQV